MKNTHLRLLTVLACLAATLGANAQEKRFAAYAVGFYNLENLFDTCHDEGKNDYQYLPDGDMRWNGLKYSHKLANMSRVLADMGTDLLPKTVGCAFIGVSEVENAKCLEALVSQPSLAARGMKFCHVEGPDRRGVDCALLYNPKLFTPENVKLVPYVPELEKDSNYCTRGFLTVRGRLAGETVTAVVCHLPSRFATSFYRETGGRQLRALKDSLLKDNPDCKIFIMGDMNDDPMDPSMAVALGAKRKIEDVKTGDLWNPWWDILAGGGKGTLMYQGAWNLFDQVILSSNLLNKDGKRDFTTLKYHKHQVFRRDYLMQQEGKYKGSPKRTHAGGQWLDGFSDHLPVVVYLIKEASK